jgi:hypothetical protein
MPFLSNESRIPTDLIDIHMRSNCIPRRRSQPRQRLNHARREPSLKREITEFERGKRGEFGGFHDYAAACCECRTDFPCPHEHWLPREGLGCVAVWRLAAYVVPGDAERIVV